jgi:DivIVA domain-containing protein
MISCSWRRRLDGRGHLTADDVRGIKFRKPPFGKRGYNRDEVDALLSQIAETIETLSSQR